MSGKSANYDLSKPVKWPVFKDMPIDVQKEYITSLFAEFNVGITALAEMLGVSIATCSKYIKGKLDIVPPKYSHKKQRERFLAEFCQEQGDTDTPPLASEMSDEGPLSKPTAGMVLKKTTLSFSGPFQPDVIAEKLAALFVAGMNVSINIDIEVTE